MCSQDASEVKADATRARFRALAGLGVFAFAIFLLMAAGSFHPGDPFLPDYPANREVRNVCGLVGAYVAAALHLALGSGSYPLILLVAAAGAFLFVGHRFAEPRIKIASAVLFVVVWACAADLLLRPSPALRFGAGGMLGRLLVRYALAELGWGAWLVLGVLFAAAVLFMTEFAPVLLGKRLALEIARQIHYRRETRRGLRDAGPEPSPLPSRPSSEIVPSAGFELEAPAQAEAPDARRGKRRRPSPAEAEAPEVPAAPPPPEAEAFGLESAPPVEVESPGLPAVAQPALASEQPRGPEPAPASQGADGASPSAEERPAAVRAAEAPAPKAAKSPQPARGPGPTFKLPSLDLLDRESQPDDGQDETRIRRITSLLERTLEEFDIDAQVVEVDRGPVITLYEIDLAPGIKIGRVVSLADDIARSLKAFSIRIVAPIPGKSTVGIEVPNPRRELVRLRELLESGVLDRKRLAIPMLIGKDSSGEPLVSDLAQMPHCLIAGATGTGKSVCMNALILSLLLTQRPDQLKLLLVDPKMVEFAAFHSVPHLLAPVLTDMKKATAVLEWATQKMDERYEYLARAGARNITTFNNLGEETIRSRLGAEPDAVVDDFPFFLPYIVIIIDELADLMMVAGKEVENSVIRLSQKSRAVGIHLIVATQRPSVDVITGLIKSNMPSRIALQVASKVDSRTILDRNGAEKLLGMGDMLFLPPGSSKLVRAQGTFVSDEEIRRVVRFLQDQAQPEFDPELIRHPEQTDQQPWERDELFVEATRIVAESQRGSVSLLQRRLQIGYSRAARLIDMMAEVGFVGDYKGSQAREVLITLEDWENRFAREEP